MLATDSKTWKKGELFFLTSGAPEPVAGSGKTNVWGIFAEDQATSTSSTTVWVKQLILDTLLEISVMNAASTAAIASTNIGTKYGVEALSNITYLDLGTASGQFEVTRLASDYMPEQSGRQTTDFDAAAGLCEVRFSTV